MPGFIDPAAPSVEAEYARYLEGDLLGKFVFKNFCRNVLQLPDRALHIPLGRRGDFGATTKPDADVLVEVNGRKFDVELKCVRVSVPGRKDGNTRKTWFFGPALRKPKGGRRRCDIAVFIGVMTLGLEDRSYWTSLDQYAEKMAREDIKVFPRTQPHEPKFLNMCGFFVIPFRSIRTNCFRVTIGAVERCKYKQQFAWGHDVKTCRQIWANAVADYRGP
jgi:hypothetical protein